MGVTRLGINAWWVVGLDFVVGGGGVAGLGSRFHSGFEGNL